MKQTEFKNGKYSGLNPVEVFNRFATMKDDLVRFLADDDNQDELLILEGKLKTKKLAAI